MADEFEPLDAGNIEDVPERYQDHPSVWRPAQAAYTGDRATAQERDIFAQQLHAAYVDPNLSYEERRQARMDVKAGESFWGVQFDWAEWRKEMGYDKS